MPRAPKRIGKLVLYAFAGLVVAALLLPSQLDRGMAERMKLHAAQIQLDFVTGAIEAYALDTGNLPADLRELAIPGAAGKDRSWLRERDLSDPWRQPFSYELTGARSYRLGLSDPKREARRIALKATRDKRDGGNQAP